MLCVISIGGKIVKNEFIVESKSGNAFKVNKGEYITIVDLEGKQVVDFFAISQKDNNEFLSTGVTIDCNDCLKVVKGDIIYTNLYNEMFEIIEDDVEEHDLLHPCCRPEMYDYFYGNGKGHRNCFDNINNNLASFKIPKQNIIHPFNIFMHTKIMPNGKLSVEQPMSKAGDKIKLQAKMDIIVCVASCSVSESKCNGGRCTPIKVIIDNN